MMEGITVLYQEPIYKIIYVNEDILNLLMYILIVMIVGVIISAICFELKGFIYCAILSFATIFAMLDSYSTTTKEIEYYEYKVTIDDSVPMKEFLSKYEIINQEGEIFTIVERENINEESK